MKQQLLTGDNIDGIGWLLSDILSTIGFDVKHCSNSFAALEEECIRNSFDGLVFFIMAETDELYSFVSRTSAESPDMKLFVLSYVKSYPMRRRLEMLGVADFFLMPESLNRISRYIYTAMLTNHDRPLAEEIISYLENKGIKINTGFFYMYTAMRMCILRQELLDDMTAGFYPMLAEPMGTTPTGAEQVLRRFGKRMQNEGIVFGDKGGKSMTANKYMISSAIDEFMSKYYHYE